MRTKRVLLITDYNASIYELQKNSIVCVLCVALEDQFIDELRAYLSQDCRSPVYVVTDTLEEQYQTETSPHIVGGDRERLLKRKLAQHFPQQEFSGFQVLGRSKDGRKDDFVVFYSIQEFQPLSDVLELINSIEIPLAGIYTIALLMRQSLKKVLGRSSVMLLSEIDRDHKSKIAYRQCFFSNGGLSLTRVSTFSDDDEQTVNQELAEEIESSRRYLTGHKLLGYNEKTTALMFHTNDTASQLSSLNLSSDFNIQRVQPTSVAKMLGLSCHSADIRLSEVFAGDLCRSHYKSHIQCGDRFTRHYYHLARWGISTAGVGIAASIIAASVFMVYQGNTVKNTSRQLNESLITKTRAVEQLEHSTPRLPYDADQIEAAVLSANEYLSHMPSPRSVLASVGAAMKEFPDLDIHKISWQLERAEDALLSNTPPPILPDDMAVASIDDALIEAAAPLLPNATATQGIQVINISGEKPSRQGEVRITLDRLQQFADRLQRDENVLSLKTIKLPTDLSPSASVKGEVIGLSSDNSMAQERPPSEFEFELRVASNY